MDVVVIRVQDPLFKQTPDLEFNINVWIQVRVYYQPKPSLNTTVLPSLGFTFTCTGLNYSINNFKSNIYISTKRSSYFFKYEPYLEFLEILTDP